jgi:hypothetical protein
VSPAGGAQAPERHFGFVEDEAVRLRWVETRAFTDCAVDVGGATAAAADDVVMVVADARFEQRRRAGRLDAAGQTREGEGSEDVVHRLRRHRAEPLADALGHFVDTEVAAFPEYGEDGEAWSRDPKSGGAKAVVSGWYGDVRHALDPTTLFGMSQDNELV